VKLSAVRTIEGILFQTVRAQHENRRAMVIGHDGKWSSLLYSI